MPRNLRLAAREAAMSHVINRPAAFLFGVRWLAWLIALIGVASGAGTETHGLSLPALLALTALASAAETSLVLRRRFKQPLSREGRRLLLAIAAVDSVFGIVVVYLSGGWGSPFYHYAVTSLLVPAFLLPFWPNFVWVVAFTGAYLVAAKTGGVSTVDVWELLGKRIGTVATPILVAFVMWYLARLIVAVSRERERAERALSETNVLFRVAEATIANLADVGILLTGTVQAARDAGLFRGFRIRVHGLNGAVADERGFGEVEQDGGGFAAPLAVRGEELGTLVATPAEGVDLGAGAPTFMDALTQQVALGVYDARLFAQREEFATQAERARIAREIHDGMAQSLYMLSLGLEACADAAEARAGELGRRLDALIGVSKQALWEARRYIFDLTPPVEGEHSLVAMVQNLTREFETVSRVPASLTIEGEPRRISPELAATLYRIGQEALANVFKHAKAGRAEVRLAYLPDAVRLSVADDGRGMPESGGTGYGLGNMRRRAEEAGGVCSIESVPDNGTTVCVEVPSVDNEEAVGSRQ